MSEHEHQSAVVIGVDPDSKAHGVAVYFCEKLNMLESLSRHDLIAMIAGYDATPIISIENVISSNPVHGNKKTDNKKVDQSIARRIGMNQQSQVELMRDLDQLGIGYMLQKPSSTWKGDRGSKSARDAQKRQFKLVTKWEGRSNPDTRSAAYMGFLALNKR